MEISNPGEILKYLTITLYTYSRICYFKPKRGKEIKARIIDVNPESIKFNLDSMPISNTGDLIFHSYSFIFKFDVRINKEGGGAIYSTVFPEKIETHDQRKYSRLFFDSKENRVIPIFNNRLKKQTQAILIDISAGGAAFEMIEEEELPHEGDIIKIDTIVGKKEIKTFAEVIRTFSNKVACVFKDKRRNFQTSIKSIIDKEIAWRSEILLRQ